MAALKPFIVENYPQDVEVLPYLRQNDNYNFDINLQVAIKRKFLTFSLRSCFIFWGKA